MNNNIDDYDTTDCDPQDEQHNEVVDSKATKDNTKVMLYIVCIAWFMTLLSLPLFYFAGYANAKDQYVDTDESDYALVDHYNTIDTFASHSSLYVVFSELDCNDTVGTFDVSKVTIIEDFVLLPSEHCMS